MARHVLHRPRRSRQGGRARPGRPRHRARREDLDPRQHPPRVDGGLLRHPHRRRDARDDLPDQLPRGMPVRAAPLRLAGDLRRGRGPAGEGAQGGGGLPRAAARDRHRSGRRRHRRRDHPRAPARARPRTRRVRVEAALRGGDARGHLPLHLYVGHHRAAQGLSALARQLPGDHRRGGRGRRGRARRQHLPVPPARACVRDPDPVRDVRAGRGDRLLVARPEDDHRRHRAGQPDLLPVGPAHVREDLHARHRERRGQGGPAQGRGGRREGAHDARRRRGGAGAARAGVRRRGGAAVQERPRPVRLAHARVRNRGRADRARDPRVLLRLRRAGDGGVRDDRDLDQRHRQPARARASSGSVPWASRRPASR